MQSADALAADVRNLRDQITHSNNISSGLLGAVWPRNELGIGGGGPTGGAHRTFLRGNP